ncbi:ABC transporter ATP-binding protein [Paenibacillus sp. YN15]|uniref:ABC transporter transmembrane domain-containing protein n=1 Tax=Paenibacillus sp. YN15 TaxID=1742774 RepID=UPI000DCC169B|nr:ABC transporter ATP-binding protein [Paenibacillus sp. YN15]RAV04654.1 hypothetical protein DQG13_05425 [Paenibacillus sp. YN15]
MSRPYAATVRQIYQQVGSQYNKYLVIVLFSSLLIICSTSLVPLYLARSFSSLMKGEQWSHSILLLSVCYVARAFFKLIRNHFAAVLGNSVVMEIRSTAMRNILRRPARPVASNHCYTHLTYDIQALSEIISWRSFTFLEEMLILLLSFIQMLRISWLVAIASLPCMFVLMRITARYGKNAEHAVVMIRDSVAEMSSFVYEIITGQKIFRVLNQQQLANVKFDKANSNHYQANLLLNRINKEYSPLLETVGYLSLLLALFVSSLLIVQGKLDVGAIVAFNNYMWLLFAAVGNLCSLALFYINSKESMKRISQYLDESGQTKTISHSSIPIANRLELERVSLVINDKALLHNINISFFKGEVAVITGEIGSGKTSLMNLIAGLAIPNEGAIKADGTMLNQQDGYRLRIGYAMQVPLFFNGTIKDNILLGRDGISQSRYEEITEACRLTELFNRLELRDQAIINKEANLLSGGEKQRVSIARALIGSPDLLLIDDAITAIDSYNQEIILDELFARRNSMILILVSNQPHIIARCHTVWSLKNGSLHLQKGGFGLAP